MKFDSENPTDMFEAVDVIECCHQDIQDALFLLKNDKLGIKDFIESVKDSANGILQNLEFVK
jgi:hypothetical protein